MPALTGRVVCESRTDYGSSEGVSAGMGGVRNRHRQLGAGIATMLEQTEDEESREKMLASCFQATMLEVNTFISSLPLSPSPSPTKIICKIFLLKVIK